MIDPVGEATVTYDGGRIATQGLDKRRLSINTIASLINYSFMIGVGVWYTPYMLSKLPEEIYGIIPLTTSFLQYMLLVMTSLSASIGRYVTADLSRGDLKAANATFNGFFFGGLKMVAGLSVAIAIFCIALPLRIPPGYEGKARFLAAAIFGGAAVMGFANCFDTAIWATSRFEIRHMIEIGSIVLRNGLVVVLFTFYKPDIWQVGVGVIAAAIFHISSLFVVWKKLTPELRVDRRAITEQTRGIIYSTGRWILASNLATAMLMSSDLIVINRLFDTVQGAKYAVVLLWVTVLRGVFGSIMAALMPSLVALEARQAHDYLLRLSSKSIRLSGALSAHSAGLLAGLSLPILTVWLKKPWVPEIAPLAWFLLLPLCLEISYGSLLPAILTTPDRIRKQALISCGISVLGVATAVALVSFTTLGIYGVAAATGGASILRYAIANPIQATVGFPAPWYFFLRQSVPTLLRFAGTAGVSYCVGVWIAPANLVSLVVCAVLVTAIALPVSVGLLPSEDHVVFRKFLRLANR